ncbi:tryptophan synthase subunit beta [Gammaproteobacteria bacterium]|nr:tryptophan synthase subunit beta [Gammaproteobacteria bacterium]MDA8924557.1 tryptophan synthase subunit beta [Gammaproteobacteria bacterium]MDA9340809.1 tryptophan synthase subunit beta [Gammaproteobacteria bacterium]MDA9371465.1 tryptophan synthase subunit beta [Gammaproteobacteria bacterium]MDC0091724.1 tryptophan synthase subunit beta [Gammaproteobacteria bacterium]|tara:strand:+ start:13376 stop:14581 length:1206 start_codon:yes stop_codon:yes gene_type:complete
MDNLIDLPDAEGFFGDYGGKFVPETLMFALQQLEDTYDRLKQDPDFLKTFDHDLSQFVGRPSPLYFAQRLTEHYAGPQIWLKREDLNHTGAHKINNTVGQILLAKAMGKKRIIAETGAGQHGVATATVAARLGLECHIYMGAADVQRQSLNVYRIKLLGATVHAVDSGTATLKDALNEALRDWVTNIDNTYYIIGSVTGPHPYPMIVRDFNSVVGRELREQSVKLFNKFPEAIIACVGGGSNAMGIFYPFIQEPEVKLYGIEAAGSGLETGRHAAPLNDGQPGILHGAKSYLMQDKDGQVIDTHSISAGLDYPGVGPEHSNLKDSGRAQYLAVNDEETLRAFHMVTRMEGIMPALETAHAFAALDYLVETFNPTDNIVINVSGRGDKDINTVATMDGISLD